MELKGGVKVFYARNRKEWRKWLAKNGTAEKRVWLIIYHKEAKTPSVYYDEAVEEALCFGWIDSTANKRDEESFFLSFAQRKPKGNWSKANRDRVERLTREGLMTPAGQAMVDLAKKTGMWMASEQNSIVPPDLRKLLDRNSSASKNFEAFPPSSKRLIIGWIRNAKRPETREKRIKVTVDLAKKNVRANHYVGK